MELIEQQQQGGSAIVSIENGNQVSDGHLLSSLTPRQQRSLLINSRQAATTLVTSLVLNYIATLSLFSRVFAENLETQKLGSWYPIILTLIFNIFDCIGKWIPAVPKFKNHYVCFVPYCVLVTSFSIRMMMKFYSLSEPSPYGIGYSGHNAALLGLSNGYVIASAMIMGPACVELRAAGLVGNIMVLSLVVGLNLGAAATSGFLWLFR